MYSGHFSLVVEELETYSSDTLETAVHLIKYPKEKIRLLWLLLRERVVLYRLELNLEFLPVSDFVHNQDNLGLQQSRISKWALSFVNPCGLMIARRLHIYYGA